MGKTKLTKLIQYEYKNRKIYSLLPHIKYIWKRCQFLLDTYADKVIVEQGLRFNFYIKEHEEGSYNCVGIKVQWSYGIRTSDEKKCILHIHDLIDIAILRNYLQKQLLTMMKLDIFNWNQNDFIL